MAAPTGLQNSNRKIEDYRPGYPQFSALLSSHPAFQNFRRFARLRMRLLLLKQDEITLLEESLDKIDTEEGCPLFLGCARRDKNSERQRIIRELTNALSEYDTLLGQNSKTLSLPNSKARNLKSLQRWIDGTASIAREESSYLEKDADMSNLTGSADSAIAFIEDAVGDCMFWVERGVRRVFPTASMRSKHKLTADEHIFLLGPCLRTISRILTTCVATAVLLTPVIVLCNVSRERDRLAVVAVSAGIFLSVVSLFTKARTMEIFTAGASYAAVLVVFTSTSNNSSIKNPANNAEGVF